MATALQRWMALTWLALAPAPLLAGACARTAEPPRPVPARVAVLGALQGDVRVKRADSDEWVPAREGAPLAAGDRIRTVARSSAAVLLEGGSTLSVSENSLLALSAPAASAVRLEQGVVDVNWSPPRPAGGGPPADLVVETRAARARVSREIVFQ